MKQDNITQIIDMKAVNGIYVPYLVRMVKPNKIKKKGKKINDFLIGFNQGIDILQKLFATIKKNG